MHKVELIKSTNGCSRYIGYKYSSAHAHLSSHLSHVLQSSSTCKVSVSWGTSTFSASHSTSRIPFIL